MSLNRYIPIGDTSSSDTLCSFLKNMRYACTTLMKIQISIRASSNWFIAQLEFDVYIQALVSNLITQILAKHPAYPYSKFCFYSFTFIYVLYERNRYICFFSKL